MTISSLDIHKIGFALSTPFLVSCVLLGSIGLNVQQVIAQTTASYGTAHQSSDAVAVSLPTRSYLPDGVYLYSNAQQAGETQKEYFVFRLQDKQVIGAFYMPDSSFDCFRGSLNDRQLNLKVITSYEQEAYDYSVSLNAYHALDQVSSDDQNMIKTCQADAGLMTLE
jgi:hypothetical protein